ncbi:ribbon-helix-helix domain-containing protein [Natrinema sp. DC36]|uniref:ribbon-helix-helix domain-containing protein n=1 Tax=Natrinema sp. DC36 TaxID=2878680 RepID=UPI001CF02488|nr:ribbon-helix-helix domain-containing protein [Natrinema sp. DC36]
MSTQHKATTHRDRETTGEAMDRVTFRETESQLERVDALVDDGQFPNRSEAIRAALAQLVSEETRGENDG